MGSKVPGSTPYMVNKSSFASEMTKWAPKGLGMLLKTKSGAELRKKDVSKNSFHPFRTFNPIGDSLRRIVSLSPLVPV